MAVQHLNPIQPLPVGPFLVVATDFASAADFKAYKDAIAEGKTEEEALAVGDNCVGFWGDPTGVGYPAAVALPPETLVEVWGSIDKVHNQIVRVSLNGLSCIAQVRDTMPHIVNITNGARIDLNPAVLENLELRSPFKGTVTWIPIS